MLFVVYRDMTCVQSLIDDAYDVLRIWRIYIGYHNLLHMTENYYIFALTGFIVKILEYFYCKWMEWMIQFWELAISFIENDITWSKVYII